MKIFLDVNQIRQFLALSRDNPRDHALFYTAFSTGLRISDLLLLQRIQVTDADMLIVRSLRIKMKKTAAWIERPVRDDCREVLLNYLQGRRDENPFLFPSSSHNQYAVEGRPLNRSSAHRIYKKYLRKMFPESIIKGAATHTARRSMGKIISQKAGRIEPASRFLGHRSTASTAAYIDMDGHEQLANNIVTEIDL